MNKAVITQKINSFSDLAKKQTALLRQNQIWIWFWRVINVIALCLIGTGVYYAINNINTQGITVRYEFLFLALFIYILVMIMHLTGWHILSSSILGQKHFISNVEAIARSNIVKYLPTIVWYIANRTHYYHQRGVPKSQVVIASLYELGFMVSACTFFLGINWLLNVNIWLDALFIILIIITFIYLAFYRVSNNKIPLKSLLNSFLWYAATWPIAGFFLWAIVSAYTPLPLPLSTFQSLFTIWLLSSIASYAVSLTIGAFGFAREITLTMLLVQLVPLPISIAVSISVKMILIIGEVTCSLILLSVFHLMRMRSPREH